jgi:hypothetical protein
MKKQRTRGMNLRESGGPISILDSVAFPNRTPDWHSVASANSRRNVL